MTDDCMYIPTLLILRALAYDMLCLHPELL